jgi:hypothetical protein
MNAGGAGEKALLLDEARPRSPPRLGVARCGVEESLAHCQGFVVREALKLTALDGGDG